MKNILIGFIALILFTFIGCEKEKRKGCTEPNAINFDSAAEENDGSCKYADDNCNTIADSAETNNGSTDTDSTDTGEDESSTFEKTNKEKIAGFWEKIEKYYVDNTDGMEQYYHDNIYNCGDEEILYTQRYIVESIEWNFREDGTFKYVELGTIYSPTYLICTDGNNPDNYWGENDFMLMEGTYEINDDKTLIFTFNDEDSSGGYLTASILKLDESTLDFEFTIDDITQRFIMKK